MKPWVVIMLSGGLDNDARPLKPWEMSNQTTNSLSNSISNAFAPPQPPPPMTSQDNSNWFGSANPSGGYYNGGYNRYGYPSGNSNTGYNSYSFPSFHMNNGPYGGGPPAPGSYITSSLENTTRPLFDSLNHVLQAINHVACFVDSTVFAVWTSVTAAGSIITAVKSIRTIYLRKWIESIRTFLMNAKMISRTSSGRKKLVLLISIVASIPFLLKALQTILKIDETSESALVLRDHPITVREEDTDSKTDLSSKAVFVRALYAYDPSDKSAYLTLNPGDVILISKNDTSKLEGQTPEWIAGKLKDGSTGYFPSNYVNVIK